MRSADAYLFTCSTSKSLHLASTERGRSADADDAPSVVNFGFTAQNFVIRHHPVWDSLYPLLFLTRNGGPLFNRGHDRALIRFDYPVSHAVADFYTRRAASMGIDVEIDADTVDVGFDGTATGPVLAFGGGKDSRLILGLTRELAEEPRLFLAGERGSADLPQTFVSHSVPKTEGTLADRLMPSLMARPRVLYLGGGLGEAHRETPWQQYYDVSSPCALAEWSEMLRALGLPTQLRAPLAILPFNITQRILSERYPELAVGQVSVRPGSRSEKNLHVSLLKYEHGWPFDDHCDASLFRELLEGFVRDQLADPDGFGYRNHRETFNREMRAIIWRHRNEELFATVGADVPDHWDGPWIDYVHDYVAIEADPGLLEIALQYGKRIDSPTGSSIRRIAV